MLNVDYDSGFLRRISKLKNAGMKAKIKKQIEKIVLHPTVGKPMRYNRRDTREVYIKPFRLSYVYLKEENRIVFLDLYHKDEQ
jgi:mRNA-degrading endonuclease RelE of RelBE toxin-antitoxin system